MASNKDSAAMFDFDALETEMPSEPAPTVVASGVAEQTKEEAERQAKVDGRNKTTGEPKPGKEDDTQEVPAALGDDVSTDGCSGTSSKENACGKEGAESDEEVPASCTTGENGSGIMVAPLQPQQEHHRSVHTDAPKNASSTTTCLCAAGFRALCMRAGRPSRPSPSL